MEEQEQEQEENIEEGQEEAEYNGDEKESIRTKKKRTY